MSFCAIKQTEGNIKEDWSIVEAGR